MPFQAMTVCYWRLRALDLLFLTPSVVEISVSDAFKRPLDPEALRSDGQRLSVELNEVPRKEDLESTNRRDRVDLEQIQRSLDLRDHKRLIWATAFSGISGLRGPLDSVRSSFATPPAPPSLPGSGIGMHNYRIARGRFSLQGDCSSRSSERTISLASVTGLRKTGIYQTSAILNFFLAQESN